MKTAKLFHLSSDELLWGFHEVNWWSRGPPAIALHHLQESGDLFEMCWREFYIRSVCFFAVVRSWRTAVMYEEVKSGMLHISLSIYLFESFFTQVQ